MFFFGHCAYLFSREKAWDSYLSDSVGLALARQWDGSFSEAEGHFFCFYFPKTPTMASCKYISFGAACACLYIKLGKKVQENSDNVF